MQIKIMKTTSAPNKIHKRFRGTIKTLNGNFRGDYDERYPVVEILSQNVDQNYAEINGKFYFISSVTYTTNKTALLYLEMDYLTTFKEELNHTPFFVDRYNNGATGTNLSDKHDPMQNIPPVSETQIIQLGRADQSAVTSGSKNQRRVLLTVMVKPTSLDAPSDSVTSDQDNVTAAGHISYLLTLQEAQQFAQSVWETSWAEAFLKFFGKPYDGVQTFQLLPFTPNIPGGVLDPSAIRVGDQYAEKAGIAGDRVYGSRVIGVGKVGVLKSDTVHLPYNPKLGFINRPPYSKYEIHIPYLGFYTLDTEQLSELDATGTKSKYGVFIEYQTSLITGETVVQVCIDGKSGMRVIDEVPVTITYDLPFSSDSYFGAISKLVGLGAITGAALLTGGAAAAAGVGTAGTAATGVGTAKAVSSGINSGESSEGSKARKAQAKEAGAGAAKAVGESLIGDQYQYGQSTRGGGGQYSPGLSTSTNDMSKIYLMITKPKASMVDRGHTGFIGTKVSKPMSGISNDDEGSFYLISGISWTNGLFGYGIHETKYTQEIMRILQGGIYV